MCNTEESCAILGSRQQAPGPLWCSWCPSPTNEDPGWARDRQGSPSQCIAQGRKVDGDPGGVGKRRAPCPALPVPVKRATVLLLGHGSVGRRTLPGNPRRSSSQWQQRRFHQAAGVCRGAVESQLRVPVASEKQRRSIVHHEDLPLHGFWSGKTRSSTGAAQAWSSLYGLFHRQQQFWWRVTITLSLTLKMPPPLFLPLYTCASVTFKTGGGAKLGQLTLWLVQFPLLSHRSVLIGRSISRRWVGAKAEIISYPLC